MLTPNTPKTLESGTVPPLSESTGSALSPKSRLAALIAREIAARFYLTTDKGKPGVYSAYYYDDEQAVEKLVEIILPLLPNAKDQRAEPLSPDTKPGKQSASL